MDEKQGIPLRLFGVFLFYVLFNAVEYISGICRSSGSKAGGDPALDL